MKSIRYLAATALATATVFSVSSTAWAQTPAPKAQTADDETDEEEASKPIVVTGSRIARPTLESDVPLTSVTVDDLTATGDVSLGDALNDLPSLRSTFSSGNSTRFIGTAGLNILDLRGLGTARTLVLVNGRRHITASPGDNLVDVNTIPVDLLDRVDIVTGGNSAVYGSDAVAGVVNFIMKRDFDGTQIKGQAGISSRGDRGSYFTSGTFGRNFGDGRGNIAVSLEYARQQPLYFRDRDQLTGAFSGRCQFDLAEPQGAAGGEIGPSATDGIPDRQFFCGIRNLAISDGGTVGRVNATTGAYLRFGPDGNLFVDTPDRTFAPFGSGNQQGGAGATLRNTGSLLAGVDRYTANLLAHFDVSDAFRPFVEAKYVRVNASGEGQPSFFNSVPATLGGPAIRCNNGFLSAASLSLIQASRIVGEATNRCLNPATGTLPLSRFNTDFGGRFFKTTRETYRFVGGVEGTFNDDWKYELSANYGAFRASGFNQNNLYLSDENGNPDGFNLAVDAIVAPGTFTGSNYILNAAGQKVICRVNGVTNARPDCFPVNVFGSGTLDPRTAAFIHRDGTNKEKANQFVLSAYVSGDMSQLFELPGGPIAFAVGAEYRTETGSVVYDDISASDRTFLNAIAPFLPPKLKVKDAYGEVRIPLLKDLPFVKELSAQAAGRVSHYNNSTGTVYAYNFQGNYAPISGLRFRAAYATSVRAPTQSDLFSTASQNFAQVTDPCDQNFIGTNPSFAKNCLTAGVPIITSIVVKDACAGSSVPLALNAPWRNCLAATSSTSFLSSGNPGLKKEQGKSLTLGVVFEPSFVPGLSVTVDYYNITVKDLIATSGLQAILNACYSSQTGLSSPFCATISRDPTTGFLNDPAAISRGENFAAQKTRGIDFDLAYRKTFDNGDKLAIRAIATRTLTLDNYTDPTNPLNPNRQRGELGDPIWAANASIAYDFGDFDLSYTARYLGKQTIGAWETQNSYKAICTTATIASGKCLGVAGQLGTNLPDNLDAFPQVNYKAVVYHNIRAGLDVNKKFSIYAGIDNMFDKLPPLGLLGTVGGDPYDSFGRYFYFGVEASF
jgi:outer membrane receptor protein involved in Fe transport